MTAHAGQRNAGWLPALSERIAPTSHVYIAFHFNVANQCLAHKKRLTAQGNQALDVTERIDR